MPISPPKIIQRKKITLDDLAAMCMREFTRIHEKLGNMDGRISIVATDLIATRQDVVEMGDRMDKRFDRVEMILSDHTFRIERLEHAVELD